jgi:hypothetical protein
MLGIVLYRLLYRFERKAQQPVKARSKSRTQSSWTLDIPLRHSGAVVEASPCGGQQVVLYVALDG